MPPPCVQKGKEMKGMHFQGGLPKDYTVLLNRFRFTKDCEVIFKLVYLGIRLSHQRTPKYMRQTK